MIASHATARYVRTSAQKAGLVLALIRGKDVNRALATLQFARKSVAEDIAKVLRSATCTVRCAVRFSTRNARPIGAGRTRFCDGPWFA